MGETEGKWADPEPASESGEADQYVSAMTGTVAGSDAAAGYGTYHETFECLPISMALLDGDGWIIDVNEQWRRFASDNGGDPNGYIGTNYVAACRDPSDPQALEVAERFEELLAGRRHLVEFEYPCHSPETRRWFYLKAYRCLEGDQPRIGVLHIEITPWRLAEEAEQHRADTDTLTGLLNRRAFVERAERILTSAERNAISVAVLFLDLDNYKVINDTYGHEMGDRVIATIGERLQGPTRECDLQGRYGGDEFVVIAENVDRDGAERVGARVRELIAMPVAVAGHRFELTCSQGIALYPDQGNDLNALIRAADRAMYRAKEAGRDRAVFAT